MATDTSKQCNITNNSGWDVIVALAVNADEGNSSNAITAANGQLEILKTSGGTVIKNGSSDLVTLDRSYKPGSGESGAVPNYDLQACDSNWLYPVANLPVAQQSGNGTTGFVSQIITKDSGTQMSSAADFYQTIMAYPDSQLTDDYTAALQSAKDAAFAKADGSADSATAAAGAIEDSMSAFFKSTDKYKTVTLADVVAIDNYYNNFPAVWAQYKDDLTYYLYGSDGETASFAGTLSLKKSGPMDATKAAGGYTCSFIPAVNLSDTSKTDVDAGKAVPLTYVNGWFTDDPKADTPKIGLKGSLMLKRLFTADATDNSLLSVITGTVNGTPCVGFDKTQPSSQPMEPGPKVALTSSDSIEKYWDTLIHPKTQHDLIMSLLTLAGAILLIPAVGSAVYGIYRIIKYRAAVKEALSKQIVERTWKEVQDAEVETLNSETLQFTRPIGERLGKFYIEFNPKNEAGYYKLIQNDMLADKLVDAFATQGDALAKVLEFSGEVDAAIIRNVNTQLDAIDKSVTNLQDSKRTDLESVLSKECNNFLEVQKQVKMIDTVVHQNLDREAQRVMDDNITAGTKLYDEIERTRTEETKEEAERDPELLDKLIPELETF